jgi:outer membrane protein assembly factor BamB
METSKIVAIVTLVLASLLVSSPFIGFASSTVSVLGASTSQHVDPITGQPYGDIMQYDWPLSGHDSGNTRFNPGPGPDRADVLWTFRGTRGLSGDPVTAVDGKIIAYYSSWFGGGTLYALDPFNGSIIWEAPMPVGPIGFGAGTVFQVDDTYLGMVTMSGVAFHLIENGTQVSSFSVDPVADDLVASFAAGQVLYWGGFYDYENKLAYAAARNATTNQHTAVAMDCSDPAGGASVAWTWGAPTGIEALGSGGGLAFFGGYGEGEVYAINATTGKLKWRQWKIGNAGYSLIYKDGKVYHAPSSTRVTCYDAEDGTILWDYDAGGRAFFSYGGALAYGLYFDKCIALPGFVAAWDAEDGEMVWKQPAHYQISYQTPAVADGKLYVSASDQREGQSVAGMESPGYSFKCYDVFTGEVIWDIPINFALPMVAYGNVYGKSGGTLYCIGENTDPWDKFDGPLGDYGAATGRDVPSDLTSPKWTYETEGPISGSPVVADDKVYFGSHDKNIYCIDAEDGSFIWKFPTGYRVASTPTVAGDRVYTGADDGNIYCINADTGVQIWKKYAGGLQVATLFSSMVQIRSSPIVVGNRLYVGAMDGNLYCLRTSDGNVEWTYTVSTTEYGLGGSPYVSEGVVYIASGDGLLYAIDAAAGTQLWNTTLTTATRYMTGTPIVVEELDMLITYAHTGGFFGGQLLRGYNTTDGSQLWQVTLEYAQGSTTPAVQSPTYYDGVIYVSEAMHTTAYELVNSTYVELIWAQWTGRQVYTAITYADAIDGGRLYFGTDVYSIEVLDAEDGSPISAYTTRGQIYGAVAIYKGRLYFGSRDWNLYCFEDTNEVYTDIWAVSSKGEKMLPNETVVISGGLRAPMTYTDERVPTLREDYYPPIANAEIKASLTKPDGTDVPLTNTTDDEGLFSFSYTPTEAGEWGWVVYYEGKELPHVSYSQSYSSWNVLEVVSPEEPTNGNGGVEPPPEEGIPIEYIYAIVAVVAIVIIAIVGYLYMRSRK